MERGTFESWAIVELFGHSRIAGKVSEQVIAGDTFLRVDVPEVDGEAEFTRFYGASAIYSITPTTEGVARQAVAVLQARPVTIYGVVLPERQLKQGVLDQIDEVDEGDDWYKADEEIDF